MKKTITTTVAALLLTTSLVGPAAADNGLLRLGIGVGAALLGEAMKGGGNHRQGGREPGKGDKLLGRVDGKQQPTRQASGKSKPAKADDTAQWAAYVPTTPAIPLSKPTDEEMVAWAAAAPEREAQEQQAEAEMAEAPVIGTDATTTAAVDAPQTAADGEVVPSVPAEEATEVARVGDEYWGKITPSQQAKAMKFGSLGMSLRDAYLAIGLKGPIDEQTEPTGRDLIDENGRLWGNVPKEVADNVWKAVDMGMKPSDAIRAIAKLEDPDTVKARAVAEAEAAKAQDTKTLAFCVDKRLSMPTQRWTECYPLEDQIAAAVAKVEAEQKAKDDAEIAQCVADRIAGKSERCAGHEDEVQVALSKLNADQKAQLAASQAAAEQKAKAEEAGNAIFGDRSAPVAENKPAFSAKSAENQATAAPAVEAEKPAIDGGKTAAIEAIKPAEQPPAKKKMKLDL
ncbi:hypothetical protein [Rhizobium leguminosarum]|uniref:hypothetical protein n=1 Tax=Rhizobium leguminosarum TaxID=384 RepID=UPI00102F7F18|nr:hypothetical protein [Rhizobium leguminosarum]TBF89106.1 hypothetical protein ELG82_36790 [Rhizobium leguminosarum]